METPTADFTEDAPPDEQPMDTAHDTEAEHLHKPQNSPADHVKHKQEIQQEENTSTITVASPEVSQCFTRGQSHGPGRNSAR
ncbi:hypothetical protein E4U17_003765 [Claviceps sp. LM77 group G4]|nr:hypothetical protein E4U17_003765 [Claviceps sp. LM77 group G4]KAG6074742.1 hypothetical protein E4U16_003788 [Claviceps sp. LM84 group G4]KAG6084850.1 hypothetical protein E4U33_002736 [Claviceps sp. LM78 group G4]